MKKANSRPIWPMLLFLAKALLCGWGIGLATARLWAFSAVQMRAIFWILILLVCMFLLDYLQTIVHECGHWLFGLLSGYRFCSFRIGKHLWLRKNGKLCRARYQLAGSGGQCIMEPPDMKNGKVPFVPYNMGGVYLNAIVGAVSLVLFWFLRFWTFPAILLFLNAVSGIYMALSNGIPVKPGMIQNDGGNTRALMKNPEAVRAFWIQLKLSGETTRGRHLRELPEEWFTVPEEAMDNVLVASVAVFACNRLLNAGKIPETEAAIAELLEKKTGMVELHRNLLLSDRIYCLLMEDRPEEDWKPLYTPALQKVLQTMAAQPCVLRTQYAIAALGEQDAEKAKKIREQFEKGAADYPYEAELEDERSLIERAREHAEARQQEASENTVEG